MSADTIVTWHVILKSLGIGYALGISTIPVLVFIFTFVKYTGRNKEKKGEIIK